jgi:hypothetical protein
MRRLELELELGHGRVRRRRRDEVTASRCRKCGAFIRWVELDTGKRMPLDLNPDDAKGNVALLGGRWHVLTRQEQGTLVGYSRFRPHFSTCPNAGEFRRRR